MTHPLGSITIATVSLALEAAARRQETFAANLANANVDGYVPQRVAFEAQLAQARASLQEQGRVHPRDLERVTIELEPVLDAAGAPARVQLDVEVAEMARNAVQYQALSQGLSRHLSLLAAAAGDGRR